MRKKVILGILLILALCAIGIVLFAKDFEVKISEEMAQKVIDAQIEAGAIQRLGVKIKLETAKVDFRANNTMNIAADLETDAFGYRHTIDGEFQSGISYRSPRLFLDNISPVKVNVQTDEGTNEELGELKTVTRKFLQRQKERVKTEDNKALLEKAIGADREAFQENIVNATYKFFETVPIYNLNNAGYKGSLASLALKDVRFTDNHAIITLSPVQALLKTLALIGTILLVLTYFAAPYLLRFGIDKIIADKKPSDT